MQSVEEQVNSLLSGQALDHTEVDIISKEKDRSFKPVTKYTVGYIVCGIAINEKGEILMMQEAKQSCRGLWYLPAGRLELGESLVDGVKREVKEETGLVYEPISLIALECGGNNWYRFTFIGNTVGGQLKSKADGDAESLQASWCSLEKLKRSSTDFMLRAHDILALIDIAVKYNKKDVTCRHPSMLPANKPHCQMVLRILIACCQDEEKCAVVVNSSANVHLPSCLVSKSDYNFTIPIFRVLQGVFKDYAPSRPEVGVLTVEFFGKPPEENDGICITLLMKSDSRHSIRDSYCWKEIDKSLSSHVRRRFHKGQTVPLIFY